MAKAGALLARRSYSRGEMRARLLKIGSEPEVQAALDRLQSVGLLNDAVYAYNFASCRIREMAWGAAKIRQSLLRRHIDPHIVASAIERVHQEISECEVLTSYLEKHLKRTVVPEDRKGIRRLISHLRGRGFDEDCIWSALRERIPAAAWQQFETGD